MQQEEKTYFDLLKKEIVVAMTRTYPAINQDISAWKAQDITDFQEDLLLKVKAQVSEKWFYSHLKAENHSLPRIDVLNLLSRYAGYANWDDFKFHNGAFSPDSNLPIKGNRLFILIPLLVVLFMAVFYGLFRLMNHREYRFSFYDAETLQPITGINIEASLIGQGESPTEYFCNSRGELTLKTDKSEIRMVVRSPYYRTDTVTRILKKFNADEKIVLHANEYALMIRYFTQMNVKDWQKRRQQLDSIIDADALIYRIYGERKTSGIELLNKQEFIDFLSFPSNSLKNMEILDVKNSHSRIKVLRYRINE